MTKLPFWLQHSDFTSKDFGPADARDIIEALRSHDWAAEAVTARKLENQNEEWCPAGIGIEAKDGRRLHICPDEHGLCHGDYSFYSMKKLLGLFPIRKYQSGVISKAPLEVAGKFIEPFIRNDFEAIRLEANTYREAK